MAGRLPPLALMTDDDRLADPLAAAAALPRGSLVVVRAREASHRVVLAQQMLALARRRDLIVLIAEDPALAAGADGLHLPERRAYEAAHWRARHPNWLISAAAHGDGAIAPGLDFAFLSPVFPTKSHPDRATLGAARANAIALASCIPLYALGGINAHNAGLLCGFVGIAAVGALAV